LIVQHGNIPKITLLLEELDPFHEVDRHVVKLPPKRKGGSSSIRCDDLRYSIIVLMRLVCGAVGSE